MVESLSDLSEKLGTRSINRLTLGDDVRDRLVRNLWGDSAYDLSWDAAKEPSEMILGWKVHKYDSGGLKTASRQKYTLNQVIRGLEWEWRIISPSKRIVYTKLWEKGVRFIVNPDGTWDFMIDELADLIKTGHLERKPTRRGRLETILHSHTSEQGMLDFEIHVLASQEGDLKTLIEEWERCIWSE